MHDDVHGECVCCGWMQLNCSRRDVLGWLFMVTKYPLFQPNALLEKADVSTAIVQSSSEHTQHAQNTAVYGLVETAE